MNYATLSIADVKTGLEAMAQDTMGTFGHLSVRQLNWRLDDTQWSVAQCCEHLLTANRLMFTSATDALAATHAPTVWQRLPLLPILFGWLLIRSQSPAGRRRFTASPDALPATTDIAADIVQRLVEQHRGAATWAGTLDERAAARAIMTSPFMNMATYSVLDGCRLVVAHDRRHFEQARRIMQLPQFPSA
ncbi:MAG: DinB family protein [Gammaproteobacteria bacterium]